MQPALQEYCRTAAQSARDELVLNHLWLVRHVVGKLVARLPAGIDKENLEAAGVLGLVEAASRFDSTRGVDFKAYSSVRIRGAVLDELRRACPLPQAMLRQVALVTKAEERLPPPVSVDDLAKATGLSKDQVLDCLTALPLTQIGSLDQLGGDWFCDALDPPDVTAEREDQKQLLADAIETLAERDRLIVTLYYMEDLRLKEIGQILKLSESRVSRLLTAAQFQLREYIRARA
jgi:RNA polymerase sigma factor for flagellar operon FliA